MPERRRVILCADDFAQDRAVCDGILRLVEAGRLSAVSCFTDGPLWPEAGAALCRRAETISIGLHFNLTRAFGYGERPLGYWIAASLTRRVDVAAVRARLLRQIDAFRAVTGRLPDFIDGHQHVHAFPAIRAVVAGVAAEAGTQAPIPLRRVSEFFGPTDAPLKRWVIRTLAGAGGAPPPRPCASLNTAMSGDYSLSAHARYAELFAAWLAAAPEHGLIVCHPAAGRDLGASVSPAGGPHPCAEAGARQRELAFLESEALAELLERHGIGLARPQSEGFAG